MKDKRKDIESDPPSSNAWGKLRSYLAQSGYTQEWINSVIGDDSKQRKIDIFYKLKSAL